MQKLYKFILLTVILLGRITTILAQTPTLVKDIYPLKEYGLPLYSTMAKVGETLLFPANNSTNGTELWKSDGTESGTTLLKDITPGDRFSSSSLSNFFSFNKLVLFTNFSNKEGRELWRSDGTSTGTYKVSNYVSGYSSSLFSIDTTLYAKTNDGTIALNLHGGSHKIVIGKEVSYNLYETPIKIGNKWLLRGANSILITDGTLANTNAIAPFKNNSSLGFMAINLNTSSPVVFFTHDDGTNGIELWRTDGTTQGTKLVKNIAPAGISSDPYLLSPVLNGIVFAANDGVNSISLWFSDGNEANTKLIIPDLLGKNGGNIYPLFIPSLYDGAKAYFIFGSGKKQLWQTDGTVGGTFKVFEPTNSSFTPFSSSCTSCANFFRRVGTDFYFSTSSIISQSYYKSEIWKSDGKPDGTRKIGDLPNATSLDTYEIINNTLYYPGYETSSGVELWKLSLCSHTAKINTPNGTNFCPGSSVDITAEGAGATGGYTYNWKQSGTNAGTNATLAVNKAGTYSVEVADSRGCVVSTSVEITQVANLPVTISGAASFCTGQTTPLSASVAGGSGTYSYQWQLNGAVITGATSGTLAANTAGVYSVSVVDAKGCAGASGNLSVSQRPSPTATITTSTGSTTFLTGNNVTLSVPTATGQTYQWLKENQPIAGATNNTYVVSQPGSYAVTVTRDGCSATSTATAIALVLALEPGPAGVGLEVSPNPVADACTIKLMLAKAAPAEVWLLDANGKPIRQWILGRVARSHETALLLDSVPPGIYVIQAIANDKKASLKLIKH